MNNLRFPVLTTALIMTLLAATPMPAFAGDEGDAERHQIRVRKVVVDCDEDSSENCERVLHIETAGGDPRTVEIGDHRTVWVDGERHGYHYSVGSDLVGKGGFLGVQLTDLTPELRSYFGVAEDEGVLVGKIVDDSAAFRAGLEVGDIITRVDGDPVADSRDLAHVIRSRAEGETVDLEIWRGGSLQSISAALDKNDGPIPFGRHVVIDCGDNEEDCGLHFGHREHHVTAFDCPDGEHCEIEVKCSDGDCDCTVDGESIDCEELHGAHPQDE